jgi:hypothetical protein
MGRSATVAAIDLTFSAPKNVSVLFAGGPLRGTTWSPSSVDRGGPRLGL